MNEISSKLGLEMRLVVDQKKRARYSEDWNECRFYWLACYQLRGFEEEKFYYKPL